jgi:rhodanese-related sulfurtransferase
MRSASPPLPIALPTILLAFAALACGESAARPDSAKAAVDSTAAALAAEMARFPERYVEEPVPVVGVAEVEALLDRSADVLIVDAREPEAYAQGHLPGAANYPYGNWLEEGKPLPPTDRDIVVYCNSQDCPIGRLWCEQAVQHGYTRVRHMKAGLAGWKEAGLPVETGPPPQR